MANLLTKDGNDTSKYLQRRGVGSDADPFSELANALGDGRKTSTTPGTAVALAATTACKTVTVRARLENTGIVVVGASTVLAGDATDSTNVRRGAPLYPGEAAVFEVDDLAKVFIDVVTSGDGVQFFYERMV